MAGVSVNAWIELGTVGYSYWSAHGPVVTDDGGRFVLKGLPDTATAWVQAWKDDRREYVQQCAVPPVVLHGDMQANMQLVAKTNLSTSGLTSAPGTRAVSGVIYRNTMSGKQPVAGAFVAFEPDATADAIAADTVSDASGFYALCGLPEGLPVVIGACLQPCDGLARVSVGPGQNAGADIILNP
jgi:hypothetical protein